LRTSASEDPEVGVPVSSFNLGRLDGTDYKSMRRYLKEFLTDKNGVNSEWVAFSSRLPILFW